MQTEGACHARPPGDRDTRKGPLDTHAARARPGPGGAPLRPSGSPGDADVARGAGSPAATGRTPGGMGVLGAHLSSAARARGPRTLPRGRRELPAGGARGPLPTVTARG